MATSDNSTYNLRVLPGTRDHRGFFVQDTTYILDSVTSSGWARICLDSAACYYVDPDNFREAVAGNEDPILE
ncbi:MAG TPA: hypothetical protein V6D29_11980 [Leptolyngbyaceae cyanobacterium]